MRISCPTCARQLENVPSDFPSRPFCSQRCKLADLNNWLSDAYRISEPVPELEQSRAEGRSLERTSN